MNVEPLIVNHVAVTRGLRIGKVSIMNISMKLRLLNHILLKNKQIDTQEQLIHSSKLSA